MGKKRVDVEIGVKNKVAAGLKQARFAIKRFGRNVGSLLKKLTSATIVLGTATAALGVKAVKAFMVQETAERALAEAMSAHGDAVDELIPKHKALAAAIQDETGISDESTIALMAKLRTIGVANDQMEQAVKLTYALSKAGMREKTAFRAAADALNGNTTQLTTYIPELRQATTDTEKLAIVNSLMVRGYAQLSGELNTNAGRWAELKGRVGDFQEAIGRAIVENASFQDILKNLSTRIKELTESGRVDEWARKVVDALKVAGEWFKKFAVVARQIIDLRMQIIWGYIAVQLGRVGVAAAMVTTKLLALTGASVAATGATATLTGTVIALRTALGGAFALGAMAIGAFLRQVWELNKATLAQIKSMRDLADMDRAMKAKTGTSNASTLRRIRETMESGNDADKEHIRKLFPKAAAEWDKSSKTSSKPPKAMAGKIGLGNGSISAGMGGIGSDTSMLSTGDLFTMMQAGTGAKRDSELSVLQSIDKGIQELKEVSGGPV